MRQPDLVSAREFKGQVFRKIITNEKGFTDASAAVDDKKLCFLGLKRFF
jgi:hypothetical protein